MYGLFLSKREVDMLRKCVEEFQRFFKTDGDNLSIHIEFLKERRIGMDHITPLIHIKMRLGLLEEHLDFLKDFYENEEFWVKEGENPKSCMEDSNTEIRLKSLEEQIQILFKTILEVKESYESHPSYP